MVIWIPAILIVGYEKITTAIFGDWNLIDNPFLVFLIAAGAFALIFGFYHWMSRES